jgi:GGDEF domain-containing protein
MTIDEVVLLLKASQPNGLTTLQEIVLRCSWEGKTYTNIALEVHYGEERVRKVASSLWQLLSDFWKEPINKFNFRPTLEARNLSKIHQQVINEFHSTATTISLEFPHGPVSLESRFYIPRPPIEEIAYTEITEAGGFICIKAPKKMGKSSLILRLLARANNQGLRTAMLDFQQADKTVFSSLDKFLRWFCANISRELQLEPKLNDYWDQDMGSKISCSIYFQEYLLPAVKAPLFLVLNEIDWVLDYPDIAGEFLPLLRSWHEQAKRLETWQKLRLAVVGCTEILVPYKLIQSTFNIGLPINLPMFTKEQVEDLAQRHGLNWTNSNHAENLMAMVGGHPYLVRLALYHLVHKGGLERDLKQLLAQASTEAGIYQEYLRQYLLVLRAQPELGDAFYQVVHATSDVKLEPILAYKLQNLGLVNLIGDHCHPACELYRRYFREQLSTSEKWSMNRVEQLEKENQQLHFLSNLDELTLLANRRYFHTYLKIEWQRSSSENIPLSLILCDIDYFKFYNKFYGSTAGDECLRQIAQAICSFIKCPLTIYNFSTTNVNITYPDTNALLVARFGGEEFAILTQVDAAAAIYIAEHIREQIKALAIPCDYPGIGGLTAPVVTVSLGVATVIPNQETEPFLLINTAEQALLQAKRKGRNRVIFN